MIQMVSFLTVCTQRLRRYVIKTGVFIAATLMAAFPTQTIAKPTSVRAIQHEMTQTKAEAAALPDLLSNPTPWTQGYRSALTENVDETNTITIRFSTPEKMDLIALLPATYVPNSGEVAAFGFPERFTIERLLRDGSTEVVVDYSRHDYIVTGVEPQLFHLTEPVFAEGLRITTLRQSENPTWWAGRFVTAFSEIMAFRGDWNLALGASVDASSEYPYGYAWNHNNLVDGFSLFSPVNGDLQSPANDFYYPGSELILNVDLGTIHTIDELRLWPVVHSLQHNFPQSSGIGFPMQIRLERLSEPNAANGPSVLNIDNEPLRPASGPLMLRFNAVQGRYFRLVLHNPVPEFRAQRKIQFALSEVELVEQGSVLTRGSRLTIQSQNPQKRSAKRLIDGLTTEGDILPLRAWIEGLNRRAHLERKLEALQQDLLFAQRQERERLFFMILLSVCITPILIWVAKLLADLRWKRVRDHFACDLHDEIGTNVSSLAHMTELIKETIHEPTAIQAQMLDEAIHTARLTSRETRNFIQLLEAEKSGFNLTNQIRKVAGHLLGGLDYTCKLEADVPLTRLRVYRQWDLLLFVKEALNNIIKHADATHVDIRLFRQAGRFQLSITDNGKGIPEECLPPRHLKTRAKRLRAHLIIENISEQGTRILLTFK